jgi:hypothetical protein
MQTVPAGKKRAARLTGGEIGPARGRVGSGRPWRSQRCTARRRGWPESPGPRAQAGALVDGGCAGLSGEAGFDSSLGELHRGVLTHLRGLDGVGKGWAGRSTTAGARVAADTPCTGK